MNNFLLVLSEYTNQSHNFANSNFCDGTLLYPILQGLPVYKGNENNTVYYVVIFGHNLFPSCSKPPYVGVQLVCESVKTFSHERISTRTRYENEAKGNSREWLPRFFKNICDCRALYILV